jgi:hypothetical protein
MTLRRQPVSLSFMLATTLALTGCGGINLTTNTIAQLRIINTSPDSGLIDAYQNNAALAYNLGFGTVTSYIAMSPGPYTLATARAGTRQTLTTAATTLAPGRQYTILVGNIAAALQQTVLLDQSQPAPAGEVSIRLIDQANRTGPVDVYLLPPHGHISTATPFATSLTFGANSGYINLPAGTYALTVVPTGSQTTLSATPITLLSGPKVAYPSGAARTLVLIDTPAEQSTSHATVQVLTATDIDPT